jgi:hypothetical protein
MEYKFYLRYQGKGYRVLKLRQGANFDITIIPRNAVVFSRETIEKLDFDDQIQLKYESLGEAVDHYTAHAQTGQRHVKLDLSSPAFEPTLGISFKDITKPIPLVTVVATANVGSQEEPGSDKWYGFQLPDDVNYLILEFFAIPKNSSVAIRQGFTVNNEKKSKETFDSMEIEMRNCIITATMRTTTHELTDMPNNIVFQLAEGKSVNIVRVEKGKVFAQVSRLSTS